MGLKLRVDMREHAWLQVYREGGDGAAAAASEIEVETVPLELGDFEVVWEEKGIRYVFERKTFQDLAASIKDGRYREQKARLLGNLAPSQITYILEDMNTQCLFGYGTRKTGHSSFFGLSKAAFQSFLYHARYRDGIHIHVSSGISETVAYLLGFAERVLAHPEYFQLQRSVGGDGGAGADPNTGYIQHCAIKSCKKENITPKVGFLLQLGQIPGISATLAKGIAQQVSSMRQLIETLGRLGSKEAIRWLQTIPLIGKKKAEVIYEYLGYSHQEDIGISSTCPESPSASSIPETPAT